MSDLHVVFGAGPLGLAVCRELLKRGRNVRLVSRKGIAAVPAEIKVIPADVTDSAQIIPVCSGAEVIYHCINPLYTRWPIDFPAIQKGIIDCADKSGAKLIFGDNLYMYGPVDMPLTENLPNRAAGPNGRIRAQMAEQLMKAHSTGKIHAAIGRGSDFFGPHVFNSHAGERLFKAALQGKAAQMLGDPDQPHSFTFIDDFAKGLVILGEQDRAFGQIWHIPNSKTMTTRQFIENVYHQTGKACKISAAPRAVVSILAIFNPMMRALREQLYQFERPFVVDHSKFAAEFGDISTPLETAIGVTLDWFRKKYVS
jgi:nucleoside-diphosphate-sugar epimerase